MLFRGHVSKNLLEGKSSIESSFILNELTNCILLARFNNFMFNAAEING